MQQYIRNCKKPFKKQVIVLVASMLVTEARTKDIALECVFYIHYPI